MSLIIEIPKPRDLVGRILSINPNVCTRFQCGGFSVNVTRPLCTVGPEAQQNQLHQALLDGRLMDITDQNIEGVHNSSGSHTPTKNLGDTGPKFYIQRDHKGNVLVAVPKDEKEEEEFDQDVATKGCIHQDALRTKIADHALTGEGLISADNADQVLSNMVNKIDEARGKYYQPRLK